MSGPNTSEEQLPDPSEAPRHQHDRYRCEECGTTLVYETTCPCTQDCQHAETCCGTPITKVVG